MESTACDDAWQLDEMTGWSSDYLFFGCLARMFLADHVRSTGLLAAATGKGRRTRIGEEEEEEEEEEEKKKELRGGRSSCIKTGKGIAFFTS